MVTVSINGYTSNFLSCFTIYGNISIFGTITIYGGVCGGMGGKTPQLGRFSTHPPQQAVQMGIEKFGKFVLKNRAP